MKIATVVGARPQFIKAVMVSRAIACRGEASGLDEVLIHTGQHFDANMSD
ncbi:MAG: UDP-N-acetylglucosamine 2-epimerase (non-hydrolyzing), partial [Gammaproteobacteria bacterium]|nr:UDP-N-acetylglucosamine 2-epimerase (non-hydrolyzing) [Acidobacteriota bacterium]NIR20846.1 UDP-N-acetylglucosamine 2-epimerase (non-hydrolyzing) [Gammaproteobacteria bacterium]